MKAFLLELLNSKKVWATIVAILVWVLGRFGLAVSDADLLPVVGAIMTFVLAQGWADKGKSAIKESLKAVAAADAAAAVAPPRPSKR